MISIKNNQVCKNKYLHREALAAANKIFTSPAVGFEQLGVFSRVPSAANLAVSGFLKVQI
jgi:hypothetical protein